MKKIFQFIAFLSLVLSASTYAKSLPQVWGATYRVRADDHGGAISTYTNLKTRYINRDLPWGVKINLVRNLRCPGHAPGEGFKFTQTMKAVGDWEWEDQVSLKTANHDSYDPRNNRPFCGVWEFYFEIKNADGSVSFDRGPNPTGFYWVQATDSQHSYLELPVQISP